MCFQGGNRQSEWTWTIWASPAFRHRAALTHHLHKLMLNTENTELNSPKPTCTQLVLQRPLHIFMKSLLCVCVFVCDYTPDMTETFKWNVRSQLIIIKQWVINFLSVLTAFWGFFCSTRGQCQPEGQHNASAYYA